MTLEHACGIGGLPSNYMLGTEMTTDGAMAIGNPIFKALSSFGIVHAVVELKIQLVELKRQLGQGK